MKSNDMNWPLYHSHALSYSTGISKTTGITSPRKRSCAD